MCVWLEKNGKRCGTAICKNIVLFLPCLVTFLGFRPYMVQFFFYNLYVLLHLFLELFFKLNSVSI